MSATYVIRKARDGQYYFTLQAGNHKVILTSEVYRKKSGAYTGIRSVRINDLNDALYKSMVSDDGKPYFVIEAPNHKVIGQSETYSSPYAMKKGMASVKRNGPKAPVRDETKVI
jgi:uncharacterized protein YegP (UPF0339 family)